MNNNLSAQFQTLLVTNCEQLVTLGGAARPRTGAEMRELSIIQDGAMVVRGGRIARVGKRGEIESLIKANECTIVDAGGRVVLPGFVDAHTHAVFAGTRVDEFERRVGGATYQEIRAAGGGIRSTVQATRDASEDELLTIALKRNQWFLRNGTTTIEIKSGYGLTVEDELKMLRVVRRLNDESLLRCVPTFLGAHDIPVEFENRAHDYIDLVINEMLPRVANEKLARFADAFCEEKVFSVEQSRRILIAAKTHNLKLRLHADQLTLSGAAKLAAQLGAQTADHLEHTDAEGIRALVKADVQPVLLPASVYALGSHLYPNARAMIDAGLAVVLATDFNPGSSPTASMPMILSLAATQMKMSPSESIAATTINAAYSLGLGDETGSLEAGKCADFCVYDCKDFRDLAYFFGIEPTHTVYINGQQVFNRDGE